MVHQQDKSKVRRSYGPQSSFSSMDDDRLFLKEPPAHGEEDEREPKTKETARLYPEPSPPPAPTDSAAYNTARPAHDQYDERREPKMKESARLYPVSSPPPAPTGSAAYNTDQPPVTLTAMVGLRVQEEDQGRGNPTTNQPPVETEEEELQHNRMEEPPDIQPEEEEETNNNTTVATSDEDVIITTNVNSEEDDVSELGDDEEVGLPLAHPVDEDDEDDKPEPPKKNTTLKIILLVGFLVVVVVGIVVGVTISGGGDDDSSTSSPTSPPSSPPLVLVNQITADTTNDGLGVSVALTGTLVAAGAPGGAYVRIFDANTLDPLHLIQEDTSTGFGRFVVLSNDGGAMGVVADNFVRIYEQLDSDWVPKGTDLQAANVSSIAISGDASWLAIASQDEDYHGSCRMYEFSNNDWVLMQTLELNEFSQPGDLFGWDVSLSSDGTRLAVGAPGAIRDGDILGQVTAYQLQNGVWTFLGTPSWGDGPDDSFGAAVELTPSGTCMVVGAPRQYLDVLAGSSLLGTNSGPAYAKVFCYDPTSQVWEAENSNISGETTVDGFGSSLGASEGGGLVAVGAPGYEGEPGVVTGKVETRSAQSGQWLPHETVLGSFPDSEFGYDVALSADGTVLVIGAPARQAADNGGSVILYQVNADQE